LESLVVMTGEGTFIETGVISFGRHGALSFSTAGQGSIGPGSGTAQGLTTGAVIWRVVGGEGQFAGATGYVTSNFVVTADGDVTDNQVAVIFPAAGKRT
jgi:hypothetical protein